MAIVYDAGPPRAPRRAASASSLLNRIEKPALADRLSQDDSSPRASQPRNNNASAPCVFHSHIRS